jgi:copper chaperone CopZ
MPARDHWIENLTCRHCQKTGNAQLSTVDALSWDVQVDSVPEGFKVAQCEYGSNFYCSTCDSAVEP